MLFRKPYLLPRGATLIRGVKRALVVAAHPDDEVLGCGGLMARLVQQGSEVHVLIMSGVTTSRGASAAEIAQCEQETFEALAVLGVHQYRRLDLPDNRFDTLPLLQLASAVEEERSMVKPDMVLTHEAGDLNVDHRLTNQAVAIALRPRVNGGEYRIWAFETLSSSEWQDPAARSFHPQVYVDISEQLELKLRSIEKYRSELRAYPHPRSLEGIRIMAQARGLSICRRAAECFSVIREIC